MNSSKLSREIVKLREEYEGGLDIGVSRRRVRELRKGKKLELHQLYLVTRIAKDIGDSKIDLVRVLTKEMVNCVNAMVEKWENFSAETKNRYCVASKELDFDNLDPKQTCMKTMKWAIYCLIADKEFGFTQNEPTNHVAKLAFRAMSKAHQEEFAEGVEDWVAVTELEIKVFMIGKEE